MSRQTTHPCDSPLGPPSDLSRQMQQRSFSIITHAVPVSSKSVQLLFIKFSQFFSPLKIFTVTKPTMMRMSSSHNESSLPQLTKMQKKVPLLLFLSQQEHTIEITLEGCHLQERKKLLYKGPKTKTYATACLLHFPSGIFVAQVPRCSVMLLLSSYVQGAAHAARQKKFKQETDGSVAPLQPSFVQSQCYLPALPQSTSNMQATYYPKSGSLHDFESSL